MQISEQNKQEETITPDTYGKILRQHYLRFGNSKIWMRKKIGNTWKEYTWKDGYENVKHITLGLINLGLIKGNNVSVIGDNDAEWFWIEYATLIAGGVITGVHVTATPPEIEYLLNHCDARFLFAKDQKTVDKLLLIKGNLPKVEKIIYWGNVNLTSKDESFLISYEDLLKQGRVYETKCSDLFEKLIDEGQGDAPNILVYTSGTTGEQPKAALTSMNRYINSGLGQLKLIPWYSTDEYVSHLPPAYAEQANGISTGLISAIVINFPENEATTNNTMKEISPHIMHFSPFICGKIASAMQEKINNMGWLNRTFHQLAFIVGYKVAMLRLENKAVNLGWKALYAICNKIIFTRLRDDFGARRVRLASVGGGLVSRELYKLFLAIGIELKILYASVETICIAQQRIGEIYSNNVGHPRPGAEVQISDIGEILVKSDSTFINYYKDQQKTKEIIEDGWVHTGDAGYFDNKGFLIVIDRLKDVQELMNGVRFSPQQIESTLRSSPYIKWSLAVGGKDKPFIVLLVNIDYDNVSSWLKKHKLCNPSYVEVTQYDEVYDLIKKDIVKTNNNLPVNCKIRRFTILPKEFNADEAEMTRSGKIRRKVIENNNKLFIETLYTPEKHIEVPVASVQKDGTKTETKLTIKLADIE